MKNRITLLLVCALWAWSLPETKAADESRMDVTEINKKLTLDWSVDNDLIAGYLNDSSDDEDEQEASRIRKQLTGEWGNNSAPISIASMDGSPALEEAYLTYNFNSDGTYMKTLKSGNVNLHEGGIWDISNDGKYLVLHPKSNKNNYPDGHSILIRIKHLELDELVLEQKVKGSRPGGKAVVTNFYFNKR